MSASVQPAEALTAGTWIQRGPAIGGRLDGIVVKPSADDPERRVILVASPGGGLWRRDAEGEDTWNAAANAGLSDFTLVHLELDESNPSRVFGVGWNRLFATTDDGESWQALSPARAPRRLPDTSVVERGRPFAQLVRGSTRFVLYAPPCGGVCWADDTLDFDCVLIDPDPSSNDNCVGFIAADPVTGYVWVSTMAPLRQEGEGPGHVFRSDDPWDEGAPSLTFRDADAVDDLLDGQHVQSLVAITPPDATEPRLLALMKEDSPLATRTFVTAPGSVGLAWVPAAARMDGCGTLNRQDGPRPLLYAGDGDDVFHGNVCLHASSDAGASWFPVSFPEGVTGHVDYRGLFLERFFDVLGGVLWVTNDGGGAEGSQDNVISLAWPGTFFGQVVGYSPSGQDNWQAYAIALVSRVSGATATWLGSQDNGAVCYFDSVASGATAGHSLGNGGDVFSLAVSSDGTSVYGFTNSEVSRLDLPNPFVAPCFRTWLTLDNEPAQSVGPGPGTQGRLATPPSDPDALALVGRDGVRSSGARGEPGSWTFRRAPHVAGGRRAKLTVISFDARGRLYAGTEAHGVYATRGASWSRVADPPRPEDAVLALAVGGTPFRPVVFYGTMRGLYRRGPIGAERRVFPLPDVPGPLPIDFAVSAVTVDPRCPDRVYLGIGYGQSDLRHGGGVWFSSNGGQSWDELSMGTDLHEVPITDIRVHPLSSRYVYVASYGRGMWIYDWGTTPPGCAP